MQKLNFLRIVGRMVAMTMAIYKVLMMRMKNENDDGDDEYGNDDDDEDENDNENGLCSNFFHLSPSSHSHLR